MLLMLDEVMLIQLFSKMRCKAAVMGKFLQEMMAKRYSSAATASSPEQACPIPPVIMNISNGTAQDHLVNAAVEALENGHIIGIPTDTIYGIAALSQHSKAIEDLYRVKKRDHRKPIAICVADIQDIAKWANLSTRLEVVEELLPGPVTLVFQRKETLNPKLNPDTPLIGVRIPNDNFIRDICRKGAQPLALTSANISSHSSSLSVEEFSELWPFLKIIFDGGHLGHQDPKGLGSTVVDLSVPGFYRIIRNGCAFEETIQVLEKHGLRQFRKNLIT